MKKILLCLLVTMSLFLGACDNSSEQKAEKIAPPENKEMTDAERHSKAAGAKGTWGRGKSIAVDNSI